MTTEDRTRVIKWLDANCLYLGVKKYSVLVEENKMSDQTKPRCQTCGQIEFYHRKDGHPVTGNDKDGYEVHACTEFVPETLCQCGHEHSGFYDLDGCTECDCTGFTVPDKPEASDDARTWALLEHQKSTPYFVNKDDFEAGYEARAEADRRELKEWSLALQSLTPGGSEFANDPEYCREYIHRRLTEIHEAKKDAVGIKRVTDFKARLLEKLDEADPLNLAPKIVEDIRKIVEKL